MLFMLFEKRVRALVNALRSAGALIPLPLPDTSGAAATVNTSTAPDVGFDRDSVGGPTIRWGQQSSDRSAALELITLAGLGSRVARDSATAADMAVGGMSGSLVLRWLDTTMSACEQEARNILRLSPALVQDLAHPYSNIPGIYTYTIAPAAADDRAVSRRATATAAATAPAAARSSLGRADAFNSRGIAAAGVGTTGASEQPWSNYDRQHRQSPPPWASRPRSTHSSPTGAAPAHTELLLNQHQTPRPSPHTFPAPPPPPLFYPTRPDGSEIHDAAVLAGGAHNIPMLESYLAELTGRPLTGYASTVQMCEGTSRMHVIAQSTHLLTTYLTLALTQLPSSWTQASTTTSALYCSKCGSTPATRAALEPSSTTSCARGHVTRPKWPFGWSNCA